jgi:outer membrane protein
MKKFIILAAVCLSSVVSAFAQHVTDSLSTDTVVVTPDSVMVVAPEEVSVPVQIVKYGYLSYSQVLENMSDYKMAQQQLNDLRVKYEMEAQYNEASFKRQFAEYLQGQKDFPQSIMLKRQRDLQEALEKSLAFREEAVRLLKQAEAEALAPIKGRLDNAIRLVGGLYGLDYIYNLDTNAMPYVNPALVIDVTSLVQQELLK